MSTKQKKGRMKLKLVADTEPKRPGAVLSRSMRAPCRGGIMAPPTMAMTNKAAPSVVS